LPEHTNDLPARIARRAAAEIDHAWARLLAAAKRVPNDRCLRILALRRSGHHAIINWIRYQIHGRHWFLNDCRLGVNPFEGAQFESSLVAGLWGEHSLFRRHREARGSRVYKGALLYNFENVDLRSLKTFMTLDDELRWFGPSRTRNDVLILRDPFNMLASQLRWAYGTQERPSKPTLDGVAEAAELWKVQAREFLGLTSFLSDRISISYNHWFLDPEYRNALAEQFGFRNRDLGVDEVAKWGPSTSKDSFDGLRYDGRAQEMGVLDRWRQFTDDPFYREVTSDPELRTLSRDIFGVLPGMESLT
jgi:hypothetical protein